MSSRRSKLTGSSLAAVLIVVALCFTAIGLMAMHEGVDGTLLTGLVAALSAIAALAVGKVF